MYGEKIEARLIKIEIMTYTKSVILYLSIYFLQNAKIFNMLNQSTFYFGVFFDSLVIIQKPQRKPFEVLVRL